MRKRLRKLWSVALTAALTVSSIVVPGAPMETTAKADTTFDNLNQSQITEAMGAGWNLGNQLEAVNNGIPCETNWGNPVIQEELILAVKDAGFKSIRIPVSYLSMIGSTPNYTIQSSWLDRVQEVVDMCVENDMYAILNMHGDGYYSVSGGWLLCGESDQTTIKEKYEACWEQIATRFKDYDEHLIFESMNEVFDGNYGNPNATAYDNINAYNQIFVDTVRQTGGNNDKRWLLIPGWNTNIDYTAGDYGFELPTDNYLSSSILSGEKRIMISVHYYSPWEFCGQEDAAVTQWGDTVTDDSKKASWGDESYLDSQFALMNNKFVDAGYPVIIGEYGSIDKSDLDVNSTANRAEFARKVCHYADIYGCVPVYWDNGFNRKFGFGLFDRSTYQVTQQTIIDAIMETYGGNASATATGISLDKTSMTIQVGDEKQTITATLTPSDSTDKITWTTSDETVATVNSKGQVTAVGVGTCTITASIPLGASATCTVTVPEASTIRAKLHLLETSGFQSIVSDEFAEIDADGGNYTLSIIANDTQLQSIGALYIRDILSGEYEASVFDYAKIKITSVEVNGKSYSMINDTFTYDTSLDADLVDGLSRNYFDFSLINVWDNTQVNDVTVDSGNYKAFFNNVSYTTCNTIEVSFQVSEVAGGEMPAVTTSPIPTTSPAQTTSPVPTESPEPTVAPTVTVKPTAEPGAENTTILAENQTTKYETSDTSWLTEAKDEDIIELKYTCTDDSYAGWGILGWGAAVDNEWRQSDAYAAGNSASDEVTVTCTAAELKEILGITDSSEVSYLCLDVYEGGKIISLSITSVDAEPTATPIVTVEPTEEPTVAPVEPTVAPVEPTVAPVEPTVEPTPTVESTQEPTSEPTLTDMPTFSPTASPETGTITILAQNQTVKYETTDTSWLMEADDNDVIEVIFTSIDDAYAGCEILGWGATVDGEWKTGKTYVAGSASEEITITCTVAALKESLGITDSSNVSSLSLEVYEGGKIVCLSITSNGIEATTTPLPSATPEETEEPTVEPTQEPTAEPTPTIEPTVEPTPSASATVVPTEEPTVVPSGTPKETEEPIPTIEPTQEPTPTIEPTVEPTPSASATVNPTGEPTTSPTATPTGEPTASPTATPTSEPTATPTGEPTASPTINPTTEPTPEANTDVTPSVNPTNPPASQTTQNPDVSDDDVDFEEEELEEIDEDEVEIDVSDEETLVKKVLVIKKGKKKKITFKIKGVHQKKKKVKVSFNKKKIVKCTKKKFKKNKCILTIKALRKGNATLQLKVGKKKYQIQIRVKK